MTDRDWSYQQTIEDCKRVPATMIPAVLRTLIETAVRENVFKPGGLVIFVQAAEERARAEG